MVSTNECPDTRQTTITIAIELRTIVLLCIHSHGAELIEGEGLPLVAYADLTEDDISRWIFSLDQDSDDHHHRPEDKEGDKSKDEVTCSLNHAFECIHRTLIVIE